MSSLSYDDISFSFPTGIIPVADQSLSFACGPVPVTDELYLYLPFDQFGEAATISLTDLNGRRLIEQNVYNNPCIWCIGYMTVPEDDQIFDPGAARAKIRMKDLPTGVYILQVTLSGKRGSKQIIKN
jgi:hypothetical protein